MANDTGLVLYLGAVRRGEFESLVERGIPCGLLQDINTKLKLPDLTSFAVVETFDFSLPTSRLVSRIREIKARHGLGCLLNVIEHYVGHFAAAAKALGLPALSTSCARLCLDKYAMKKCFVAAIGPGATARFMKINSESQRCAFAREVPLPHTWKPTNLSASLFVSLSQTEEEEARTYLSLLEQVPNYYRKTSQFAKKLGILVEEFIEGTNHSIDCLVDRAGNVTATPVIDVLTGRDVGLNDFHHFARLTPSRLSRRGQEDLAKLARAAVQSLGMKSCVAHVEFVSNKLLEVGARPGGNRIRILQMAYGIDELYAYYEVLNGRGPRVRRLRNLAAAIITPFPSQSGMLLGIRHQNRIRKLPGYAFHEVRTAVGQRVGLSKDGFKAPLYIELISSDREELYRSVAEIASWTDLFKVEIDGRGT